MIFIFRIISIVALLLGTSILRANPVKADYATVELIPDSQQITRGASFNVALKFDLDGQWHIYWQNPGSSGLPLELEWRLPDGLAAGDIQWPSPKRFDLDGYITYGYEKQVTFIVPISVAETFSGESAQVEVDAFWLICDDLCLPGDAKLSIELPVGDEAILNGAEAVFEQARESQPILGAPWELAASLDIEAKSATIRLRSEVEEMPRELYFYAASEGVTDSNAEQILTLIDKGSAKLEVSLDQQFVDALGDELSGVLQSASGDWFVNLGFGETITPKAESIEFTETESGDLEEWLLNLGLPGFLVAAFLGGVILNVMPCVLPVLSLKVFSLLKHAGQSKAQALVHGLAYTAGVVISFVALAAALFVLRSFGERVGWGFQLQNSNFVVILAVVLFLFGLNLMGVFEIGTRFVGADAKVSKRNDVFGSFGMGVLAAVVGAPCMGPMVASVSGIAVQATVPTGLLIFGTMGLGLAAPFLLLSVFPKLVAYLPKPGVWMESFKQFMGFLLMAAVAFLIVVVADQRGTEGVTAMLVLVLFAALAAWIYGRWATPVKSIKSKLIASLLSLILVIGGIVFGIQNIAQGNGQWQPWSSKQVEAELAAGNPVFVDFTATWCLICQVNKKVALRTDATTRLFAENGIVALEADWTRYDAAITDELERFGRTGVPLYVLYMPNGEAVVLPQSLTKGTVRDTIENAMK